MTVAIDRDNITSIYHAGQLKIHKSNQNIPITYNDNTMYDINSPAASKYFPVEISIKTPLS
jgi:hypothetical protein